MAQGGVGAEREGSTTKQNCYLVFSGAWEGKSQIEGKCKKI